MDRRTLLKATLATVPGLALASRAQDAPPPAPPPATPPEPDAPGLSWHDAGEAGLEGRGFADTSARYDRLPARAEAVVRPEVWTLSRCSAGMAVHFQTDATDLHLDAELLNDTLAMPHMPATGVSGLDLYTQSDGVWRWVSVARPRSNPVTGPLVEGLAPGHRTYRLYLPLYNGVVSLKLGVPAGARFAWVPPRTARPILFYGTSITQGACASRPGMAFVNLLGRRLGRPVLNFGFSGQGKTEPQVAGFLGELDPAVFVLDCVANTPVDQVEARSTQVVSLWRRSHPHTPIVMVEDRTWCNADLVPAKMEAHRRKRAGLRRSFEALRASGLTGLHYVPGDALIGDDHEATTDGSHPSDLGMARYADALEPVLRSCLDP